MAKKRIHHYPTALNRDHARPRTAPAPPDEVVERRLAELIAPATYTLAEHYRGLGLRWRVLTLPVMVALVLTLIWRQVPSLSTLVAMLVREPLLWEPPRRVSQQALSLRLRTLPAALFEQLLGAVLPTLQARAAARARPLPAAVGRALQSYERTWILDATTLEALFKRVGLLRGAAGAPLGGKLLVVLDLASKLPVRLWWGEDATANEKRFLERVKPALLPGTLLLLDRGFYAFPFFDWLTEQGVAFVTRLRAGAATPRVERVLLATPTLRDRVVRLGQRRNPCTHPLRLVEVLVGGAWHGYLTNELDPNRLPAELVVGLYGQRWRVEEAFLLVKRLLGLAYLRTGAANGIQLQAWATWLLYAVLVDLSDAVAEELALPLERISLEMVFRGLYFFVGAHARGEATDPVAYLAAQPDLGIVKRRRQPRDRPTLDNPAPELNL
jgi:hypothetical protein